VKHRVFLDTNIIFDLLGRRDPYYPHAAALFSAIERGLVEASASSLTYANLHYVLRKEVGSRKAVEALTDLRKLVAILPVDDAVIARALASDFNDFEDAIQYHAALAKGVEVIITRNTRDYSNAAIPVMTAGEFLAHIGCVPS